MKQFPRQSCNQNCLLLPSHSPDSITAVSLRWDGNDWGRSSCVAFRQFAEPDHFDTQCSLAVMGLVSWQRRFTIQRRQKHLNLSLPLYFSSSRLAPSLPLGVASLQFSLPPVGSEWGQQTKVIFTLPTFGIIGVDQVCSSAATTTTGGMGVQTHPRLLTYL